MCERFIIVQEALGHDPCTLYVRGLEANVDRDRLAAMFQVRPRYLPELEALACVLVIASQSLKLSLMCWPLLIYNKRQAGCARDARFIVSRAKSFQGYSGCHLLKLNGTCLFH